MAFASDPLSVPVRFPRQSPPSTKPGACMRLAGSSILTAACSLVGADPVPVCDMNIFETSNECVHFQSATPRTGCVT